MIRAAARRAEDDGDLVGAGRLLALLAPDPDVRRWSASIEAGLRCRDDTERALWQLQPAFRYGCTTARRHALHTLAADVLRSRGTAAVAADPASAACAFRDPLLVDAGLFDLGMLADYLTRVLTPRRHPLLAVLQGWVGRPATVWEVRAFGEGRLELTNLLDGTVTAARSPLPGIGVGDLLYGRVVPLPAEARFPLRPIPVDRVTGRRVLRAVVRTAPLAERLRAVASYQRRGLATAAP